MAIIDLTSEEGISTYLRNSNLWFCPKVKGVERLSEGFTGFVFRVYVDGLVHSSIIIKHAASYAARAPLWKLDQSRMVRVMLLSAYCGFQN